MPSSYQVRTGRRRGLAVTKQTFQVACCLHKGDTTTNFLTLLTGHNLFPYIEIILEYSNLTSKQGHTWMQKVTLWFTCALLSVCLRYARGAVQEKFLIHSWLNHIHLGKILFQCSHFEFIATSSPCNYKLCVCIPYSAVPITKASPQLLPALRGSCCWGKKWLQKEKEIWDWLGLRERNQVIKSKVREYQEDSSCVYLPIENWNKLALLQNKEKHTSKLKNSQPVCMEIW